MIVQECCIPSSTHDPLSDVSKNSKFSLGYCWFPKFLSDQLTPTNRKPLVPESLFFKRCLAVIQALKSCRQLMNRAFKVHLLVVFDRTQSCIISKQVQRATSKKSLLGIEDFLSEVINRSKRWFGSKSALEFSFDISITKYFDLLVWFTIPASIKEFPAPGGARIRRADPGLANKTFFYVSFFFFFLNFALPA